MDFESPDVMKDFPGLYASDINNKAGTIDSDDAEKATKKESLIGKRKDKKDKKDKDRGYAALEGESSAEENESRSPSKSKKSKSFKFPSKSKEKREKSREKEYLEKKKDKDKKSEKKVEKEKVKLEKKDRRLKSTDEPGDIAEELPIFGVSLELAIKRSRCHDGLDIPQPVRSCIDYVQAFGLTFESVYKISAPKSKIIVLKKLYNHRENVTLSEYDVPTVTSLLKSFLRELPEPIFTTDLSVRFEEAGAILNVAMREKHLKIVVNNLPFNNKLLLSWLVVHFYNVTLNEKHNKMNVQNLAGVLGPTLQTSSRVFTALICHCPALFPDVILEPYIPPLTSSAQLPEDLESMEQELSKQESLLSQIHSEMNAGYISKQREELLWEVQRIITQLKRKLKILYRDREMGEKSADEKASEEALAIVEAAETSLQHSTSSIQSSHSPIPSEDVAPSQAPTTLETKDGQEPNMTILEENLIINELQSQANESCNASSTNGVEKEHLEKPIEEEVEAANSDKTVMLLQFKHDGLIDLRNSLLKKIKTEKLEIAALKSQLNMDQDTMTSPTFNETSCASLDEIMALLQKENQILQIKKINLVRQIMEQQEICIELKAKLNVLNT